MSWCIVLCFTACSLSSCNGSGTRTSVVFTVQCNAMGTWCMLFTRYSPLAYYIVIFKIY